MNMLVYKDGKIVMNEAGKPLEGEKPLENLYACISDPEDGDTLVYDGNNHMWKTGAGGGGTSGGLAVTLSLVEEDGSQYLVFDKTWKECCDVASAGGAVMIVYPSGFSDYDTYIVPAMEITREAESGYAVSDRDKTFTCESETGYPTNQL